MTEEWMDIKNYEGVYQVSNLGRVKRLSGLIYNPRSIAKSSLVKERIMRDANDRGYRKVALCRDAILKTFRVHQLVWDTFICIDRTGLELDHKDGNKANNTLDNLQLLTHSENVAKQALLKNKSSKYTGVMFDKERKKWRAEKRIKNIRYYLGRFGSEEEAMRAYNAA